MLMKILCTIVSFLISQNIKTKLYFFQIIKLEQFELQANFYAKKKQNQTAVNAYLNKF